MKLQSLANTSIGSHTEGEEDAIRAILDIWIAQVRQIDMSLATLGTAMIEQARKTEYFEQITSLKGIAPLTAARFIAEVRDLHDVTHYKQIEKYAGANVRLMDSGKYAGARKISKIGNKRLLRLIYLMTTQTVKFIPELRIKFITRQLKSNCFQKNIIAVSPWLLKLIMALIREKRSYAFREEAVQEMRRLEAKYTDMKSREKKMKQAA